MRQVPLVLVQYEFSQWQGLELAKFHYRIYLPTSRISMPSTYIVLVLLQIPNGNACESVSFKIQ